MGPTDFVSGMLPNGGTSMSGLGASYLNQKRAVGAPGLQCQHLE